MNNLLDNGTVLPSGLLSGSSASIGDAFKKTYQNCYLRVGIVIKSYSINDEGNITKRLPEYDIMAFEQNENIASTISTYKNCIAMTSFGSIADFFEANIRSLLMKSTRGVTPTFSGQNGSIVLLLCLNALSDAAIIIGCLGHPDRPTLLTNDSPHLEGEYNGVHITVNEDGSTSLTFKGATDNDGNQITPSQGNTVIQIEKDGTFQVNHSTITFRLDRNGTATLTTEKDTDLNVSGNVNIVVTGDANVTTQGKTIVTAKEIHLNGEAGKILTTVTDPVIDTIFGTPTQGVPTVKAG